MADLDQEGVAGLCHARMVAEAEQIAATPEFARAPMMQRLLNFLVAETLAGRGDQLKAYSVAVDGLGRAADFDARSDSYPRVQVGRLRKLINRHYACNPRADGLRLHIPQGGYRVALEQAASVEPAPLCAKGRAWLPRYVVHGIVVLAGFAALAWFLGLKPWQVAIVEPPVLTIGRIWSPGLDAGRRDAISATLLDGLRRSNMFQLSAPGRSSVPPRYMMSADVTPGSASTLYLRLWRLSPDRLLWSDKVLLPDDPARYAEAVAPLVTAIGQPFGVVATAERAQWGSELRPGYPCLLLFHEYRVQRAMHRRAELQRCVQQTLDRDPDHVPALAAASTLALDEELYPKAFQSTAAPGFSARVRAWMFARRAVAADPFSALANQALARASLFTQSCAVVVRSGTRAVALNPYDPTVLANVGIYLIDCGDPRGEEFARRAVQLDPNSPIYYATLVYVAVDRGDGRAARAAAAQMELPNPVSRAFHHLIVAIALAADGDTAGARRAWERLEQIDPGIARDPEAALRRWQLTSRIRGKCMALLAQAGLIPPATPAGPRNAAETALGR